MTTGLMAEKILRLESRMHTANEPGAFFEWHAVSRKVFVLRKPKGRAVYSGDQIGEAGTPDEAKQIVAAYTHGFAHAKGMK